jgi:hypothetical protein
MTQVLIKQMSKIRLKQVKETHDRSPNPVICQLIDGCFSVIAGCQKCRYKGSFVTCHQNLAV